LDRKKLPRRRHHTSPQLEITNVGKATALSPLYRSGRGGPSRIRCVKRCTPNTCWSTHKDTATQRKPLPHAATYNRPGRLVPKAPLTRWKPAACAFYACRTAKT
jgi:hypothetical protein